MSVVDDLIKAVNEEQDLVVAAIATISRLTQAIKDLAEAGDLDGIKALVAEVEANKEALVTANLAGTAAADLIVVPATVAE